MTTAHKATCCCAVCSRPVHKICSCLTLNVCTRTQAVSLYVIVMQYIVVFTVDAAAIGCPNVRVGFGYAGGIGTPNVAI